MKPHLPGTWVREFPDEKPALSAEELYLRYLERNPGHISDLVFVLACKQTRTVEREEQVP